MESKRKILIEQRFYRLSDAAHLLDTSEDHLLNLGAMGKITFSAPVINEGGYCWGKYSPQLVRRPDLEFVVLFFGAADRVVLPSTAIAEMEATGLYRVSSFIYDDDSLPQYNGEIFFLNSEEPGAYQKLAPIERKHLFLRAGELKKLGADESKAETESAIPESLGSGERATLQRQVAGLALLLAEKASKYRKGDRPNGSQIAEAIGQMVDAIPDANRRGLSSANIRNTISEGLRLLTE